MERKIYQEKNLSQQQGFNQEEKFDKEQNMDQEQNLDQQFLRSYANHTTKCLINPGRQHHILVCGI